MLYMAHVYGILATVVRVLRVLKEKNRENLNCRGNL